jgi:cell division protein FtsQ
MPRVKSKGGTRRSSVVARSQRQAKAFRLSQGLKRVLFFSSLFLALLWGCAWLTSGGAIGRAEASVANGFYRMTARNGFAVKDILVEGRQNADTEVLLGLIHAERGDPIFAFNPTAVRESLEREPWIAQARVERRLPGVIFVSIVERKPFALWQNQNKVKLIDADGVVISDVKKEVARFSSLPLVVGDGAEKKAAGLLDLMKAEPLVLDRMIAAMYVGDRRWDLRLKNSITVRLPEEDMAVALRRLGEAQEKDGLLDKALDTIDLREASRIIIRVKPDAAAEEYKVSYQPEKAI